MRDLYLKVLLPKRPEFAVFFLALSESIMKVVGSPGYTIVSSDALLNDMPPVLYPSLLNRFC